MPKNAKRCRTMPNDLTCIMSAVTSPRLHRITRSSACKASSGAPESAAGEQVPTSPASHLALWPGCFQFGGYSWSGIRRTSVAAGAQEEYPSGHDNGKPKQIGRDPAAALVRGHFGGVFQHVADCGLLASACRQTGMYPPRPSLGDRLAVWRDSMGLY